MLKGIFSGLGSMVIAFIKHEAVPKIGYILAVMLLGFVAYGLSIFMYVRAQNILGAAQTSAYYAAAPFVGVFLSFVLLHENLSWTYLVALAVMAVGSALAVADTLVHRHIHEHQHTFTHAHGGLVHSHTITHSHGHNHYRNDNSHGHYHTKAELERELGTVKS